MHTQVPLKNTDVIQNHSSKNKAKKGKPPIPCSCIAAIFSKENPRPYIMNKVSGILILSILLDSILIANRMKRTRKLEIVESVKIEHAALRRRSYLV